MKKEKLVSIEVDVSELSTKLWNLAPEQTKEFISDLNNMKSFDDISKDEYKFVNKLIRSEKIKKLNGQ